MWKLNPSCTGASASEVERRDDVKLHKVFIWVTVLLLLLVGVLACNSAPEIGSPAWCEALEAKPRGEWKRAEILDYADACIGRNL
jgi:hypothetical protein